MSGVFLGDQKCGLGEDPILKLEPVQRDLAWRWVCRSAASTYYLAPVGMRQPRL